MTQTTKRIALLFFAAALVAVILLSVSLSNLEFHHGSPFPGGGNSADPGQPVSSAVVDGSLSSTLLKGIFDLILLILLISVPARLIPLVNMKRLSQVLLVVIALLLIANLLSRLPGNQPVHVPGEPSGIPTQTSSEYPVSPLGQPPDLILWFVVAAVVLGAGFLAIRLGRQGQPPDRINDQISQQAESAIQAIQLGEGLRSVIIRCYLQMGRALQEEQHIERSESMTVREFEDWLTRKGFPIVPVHRLSRLFEKVRYGHEAIVKEDEMAAVESLNAIIEFCESQRESIQ